MVFFAHPLYRYNILIHQILKPILLRNIYELCEVSVEDLKTDLPYVVLALKKCIFNLESNYFTKKIKNIKKVLVFTVTLALIEKFQFILINNQGD